MAFFIKSMTGRLTARRGASAMQYATMLGLIAVIALASIAGIGSAVTGLMTSVSNRLAGAGNSSAAASGPTAPTAIAPVNTVLPTISGTVAVGQTLTATTGTWTASPAPSIAYQWTLSGAPISGATNATYQVQASDIGGQIRVAVTATNTAGSSTATSAPTITVPAPVYTNCQAARDAGNTASGIYVVHPPSASTDMSVFCDMVGATAWMLMFRDPSTSFDVPTIAASSNAWTGTLGTTVSGTQGMLAVTKAVYDELAPVKAARFADFNYSDVNNTATGWWVSGADTGIMFPSSSSVGTNYFFYTIQASNAYVGIGRWNGSGQGCPQWSSGNVTNMTQGTAGTGDANAHNGGGCWSAASTGPTYGGYAYVR